MALSSDSIDAAIICSTKALEFVKADDRFVLIPNIIVNSSIIVLNENDKKKIGISFGRDYEKDMVHKMLGNEYEIFELSSRALPYALNDEDIGGVVVDWFGSYVENGVKLFPKSDQSFGTYSMIIKKEFSKSNNYKAFIEAYEDAAKFLNEKDNMLFAAEKYLGRIYTNERRYKEWQMLNFKIQIVKE